MRLFSNLNSDLTVKSIPLTSVHSNVLSYGSAYRVGKVVVINVLLTITGSVPANVNILKLEEPVNDVNNIINNTGNSYGAWILASKTNISLKTGINAENGGTYSCQLVTTIT